MAHPNTIRPSTRKLVPKRRLSQARRAARPIPKRQSTPFQSRVSAKGQLVIPAELRERYHITKGTSVRFEEVKGGIMMRPITDEYIHSLMGILAGRGIPFDVEKEPDPDRSIM